jgi:hypothetical protein
MKGDEALLSRSNTKNQNTNTLRMCINYVIKKLPRCSNCSNNKSFPLGPQISYIKNIILHFCLICLQNSSALCE